MYWKSDKLNILEQRFQNYDMLVVVLEIGQAKETQKFIIKYKTAVFLLYVYRRLKQVFP